MRKPVALLGAVPLAYAAGAAIGWLLHKTFCDPPSAKTLDRVLAEVRRFPYSAR